MRNPPDGRRSTQTHRPQGSAGEAGTQDALAGGVIRASRLAMVEFAGQIGLRGKFLLSLVLVIVALTTGTLLAVRHSLQVQARRQINEDARNALLTFQLMAQKQRSLLSHKAELLATLAFMRDGDPSTLREISQDPWQSEDCDLFALTDAAGRITALQRRTGRLSGGVSDQALGTFLKSSSSHDWWVSGSTLYQVVVKPYYQDPPLNGILLGKAVVGREIDAARAKELSRILSGEVAFQYGAGIAVSSLLPFQEQQLLKQVQAGAAFQEVRLGKDRLFASSVELEPGGPSLVILKSGDEALAALARLNQLLLGLGLVAVFAGGALVYLISDTFTRPLAALAEGVRALERGNFSYPLASNGNDEVARLTRTFDSVRHTLQSNESVRQQLEEQLRQSQKMDALGRLAGGVAHDFNNLLTVIKGHSDLVLDRIEPSDPIRGSCEQIRAVSDRAATLTRQLLAFSRRQMLQPKVLDLNDLIAEMGALLRRLLREDIECNLRLGESLARVHADPGQLEQVLLNLTVNAADAMQAGGTLTIETKNISVDDAYASDRPSLVPAEYVMLSVTDSGHGMTPDVKARIFEPFFTTKEPGKGTGLGLATVYGIVKQSSGCVFVESEPGHGTRFEIFLPQVHEAVEAAPAESRYRPTQRAKQTILVVEDQDDVRALTCEFLSSAGYQVLTASDGAEALAIGQRLGKSIRILVSDVVMPRMRGPEVARHLKELIPGLKVVYTSGYVEACPESELVFDGASFLQKPFSRDALLRAVEAAARRKPVRHSDRTPVLQSVVQ
jgi:signal transduction histidine kinase/ActR/RegA family two-component response regulator